MKPEKSFLKTLTALTVAVIIAVGTLAIGVFADGEFGTYEEGIKVPSNNGNIRYYTPVIHGDGFPNLDFEQGFMYWTSRFSTTGKQISKITDIASLKKDSKGNTYIHIDAPSAYYGVYSPKFKFDRLEAGSSPAVLYKWRGEQHYIQVYLEEYYNTDSSAEHGTTITVSGRGDGKVSQIWPADEDDPEDWNIAVSLNNHLVEASTTANTDRYYLLGVEVIKEDNWMEVDDLQIVIHNQNTQKLYDLDGNLLYDLNNLPTRQYVDYDWGDLSETVDASEDVSRSSASVSGSANIGSKGDGSGSTLYLVIIGVAVIVVAAAAVATIVVIKKKKTKVSGEKSEEAADTAENSDIEDTSAEEPSEKED